MRKGMICKSFIYFLSISFLLCVNGFPATVARAREINLPIGEMVSIAGVKFETKQNIWEKVEPSYFPVLQGVRIRTEKGKAAIALANTGQIMVGPNSLFFFDQADRFVLSQGSIEFRIPSLSEIDFKVGNLFISNSRTLQAANNPRTAPRISEQTMGSIFIHSNGSVTVKTVQGKLSVLNQARVVLAALSSKDSVTIPSITVEGKPRLMVAQVGETAATEEATEFLGLSTWTWLGIIAGAAAVGGMVWAIAESQEKERRPICP